VELHNYTSPSSIEQHHASFEPVASRTMPPPRPHLRPRPPSPSPGAQQQRPPPTPPPPTAKLQKTVSFPQEDMTAANNNTTATATERTSIAASVGRQRSYSAVSEPAHSPAPSQAEETVLWGFFHRLGAIELENKGSVARDHLALGKEPRPGQRMRSPSD
jgi:hypothetical protein